MYSDNRARKLCQSVSDWSAAPTTRQQHSFEIKQKWQTDFEITESIFNKSIAMLALEASSDSRTNGSL
ncbi:hypothetical protein IH992_30515 [Candidatus Poribacteria bacterium]|nr:hypothetical protein [Candidatus Poribacteria bacterium]